MTRTLRIAYLGMPLGALLLEDDGHALVWIALSRRDSPGTRRVLRRFPETRLVPDMQNARNRESLAQAKPDLLVSWFWTQRLPAEVLRVPRLAAFGVHPSLLPRHRGPDPYYWAIRAGDRVTGVTAHLLEDMYDTGPILAQREMPLDPTWNSWTLAKKLDRPSLALLREVVASYATGASPSPVPQSESFATEAPLPSEDELVLRWNRPTEQVHREILAASPWPGAVTFFGEQAITITRVERVSDFPRMLEAGEALASDAGVIVRTQDGALRILAARDEMDRELTLSELASKLPRT